MSNSVETVRSAFDQLQARLDALRVNLDTYTPPIPQIQTTPCWLRPKLIGPSSTARQRFADRLAKWQSEPRQPVQARRAVDPQVIADVLRLRAQGLSYAQISRQLPISSDRAGKICRDHGLAKPRVAV